MNNKILVVVYSPLVDEEFDMFIPINKKVGTIKNIIMKTLNVDLLENHILINQEDNKIVEENVYVQNSGIKNGARLMLI